MGSKLTTTPTNSPTVNLKDLVQVMQDRLELYRSYVGNAGFGIVVGDKTCFDHTTNKVVLGANEFVGKQGREISKIDFDVYHELGHLIQLFSDPKAYLKLINDTKDNPTLFDFYNCVLDVTVNSLIRLCKDQFRDKKDTLEFSVEIKDYYRKELFEKRDLSDVPLATQFYYYLLNLGMGVSEDLQISSQVREELDKKIKFCGNELTVKEILDNFIKPQITTDGITALKVGEARTVIDTTLLPIFKRLFALDPRQPEKPRKVSGILGNPNDLANAIKAAIKIDAERNLTPEERKRLATLQALANKFPDEKDFADRIQKLSDEINALKNVLKRIRKEDLKTKRKEVDGVPEGDDLAMDEVIHSWEDLTLTIKPPIMIGEETTTTVKLMPKKLRMAILLDLSGSMGTVISKVKDVLISTVGAVISANLESEAAEEDIRYEIGVYGYSDDVYEILSFTEISDFLDLKPGYDKTTTYIGTQSHLGYQELANFYQSAKEKIEDEQREQEEVIDVLIEVTDGDTSNTVESKNLVEKIKELGVKVIGIKFTGEVLSDSSAKNEHQIDPLTGQPIKPEYRTDSAHASFYFVHADGKLIFDIRQLSPAILESLSEIIEGV